jgi:hypothetical protein
MLSFMGSQRATRQNLSDLAHSSKSWVQTFVDRAKASVHSAPSASPLSYAREAGSVGAEYLSGGAIGALLGATHAKFGLDKGKFPIDGLLAAAGGLAGIALSGHMPEVAAMARRAGAQAFTIFTFRRSYELVAKGPLSFSGGGHGGVTRIAAPGKGPGVGSSDPIEKAASKLESIE